LKRKCKFLDVTITTDDYPEETSFEVKNQNGKVVMSGDSYEEKNKRYDDTSCLPYGDYQFIIYDTYGDGMCCSEGRGGYELYVGDTLKKVGGDFNKKASVEFSLNGLVPPTPVPTPGFNLTTYPGDVKWIKNKKWFEREKSKGCCPYAKILYKERYANIDYRCCSNRLHELEPLEAVGSLNYLKIMIEMNSSVLIYGDSLAEQHFLFMICYAWSLGRQVNLEIKNDAGRMYKPGTEWEAHIGYLNIKYYRWDTLTLAPINITEPDYFIVGGWHHEKNETNMISILPSFF